MTIDWNEAYTSGRDYRPMNQLLLGRILAKDIKSEGSVLDIGCGTGDLAIKLARRGYNVTGIDLSKVAVEKAQQRAAEVGAANKVKFSVADITDAAQAKLFEDEKYDLITCKLVFAFVQDKPTFLNWVKNHLTLDGRFVLITPVLHPGIEYTPRLRNISVDYEALAAMLGDVFGSIVEIHQEYFDEWGDERTFILG